MAASNDALSAIATAYGVKRGARRSNSQVAKSVKKASVLQHPGVLDGVRLESFAQVVGILAINDREEFDRFRSGAPIPSLREAMVQMVTVYEGGRERAEQVVDLVLGDLAARVRGDDIAADVDRSAVLRGANERGNGDTERPSLTGVVGASALAAFLSLAARKDRHSPRPQTVRGGPEVDVVVDLAEELAEQGRDDEAAVRQLRAVSKGRKRVIERALAMTRMGPEGYVGLIEFRSGDLMERLLVAAASSAPLQPRSAEQEAWCVRIDALRAGGPDVAYARLKLQVPDLDVLEREVRGYVATKEPGTTVDDDWWEGVYVRLERMVGWKSQLADPILRSGSAFAIAVTYLLRPEESAGGVSGSAGCRSAWFRGTVQRVGWRVVIGGARRS